MKANYGTKWSRTDAWTGEEDLILMAAYHDGASYKKMMRILNRGYSGISSRLRKLKNENA